MHTQNIADPNLIIDSISIVKKHRENFQQFLERKGLRLTAPRQAIFDAAVTLQQPYTADDLLDAAKMIDDTVSRATVYRTLPILIKSGVVRELDVAREHKYYRTERGAKNFQAQVICENCEKIFEIDAPFMDWYGRSVAQKIGMEVESYRLQVHARCDQIRQKGLCTRTLPCPLLDLR
jgi:Fur family transcriptional regulator, ferric uptake regulator